MAGRGEEGLRDFKDRVFAFLRIICDSSISFWFNNIVVFVSSNLGPLQQYFLTSVLGIPSGHPVLGLPSAEPVADGGARSGEGGDVLRGGHRLGIGCEFCKFSQTARTRNNTRSYLSVNNCLSLQQWPLNY